MKSRISIFFCGLQCPSQLMSCYLPIVVCCFSLPLLFLCWVWKVGHFTGSLDHFLVCWAVVIVCDIFLQLCYRRFFSCHAKFTPKGMRISSFHFKARNCTRQLSFSFLCNCCWIFFLLVHSWFCYSLVSSVQPNCVSGKNVSRIIHYCVSDLHVADCHGR